LYADHGTDHIAVDVEITDMRVARDVRDRDFPGPQLGQFFRS